jgi:L-alanine-DL-glutamate epimerase-like enolase superfamily enzyme
MNIKFYPFQLQLKHTFTISRESHDIQPSLVVALEEDGIAGFGEATANTYYGVTVENMIQKINAQREILENHIWQTPEQFEALLRQLFPNDPFIRCALDIAANDLYAKKLGKPLYKVFGLSIDQPLPLTNYTIGIDSIDKMIAKMEEVPWPIYKIKLGTERDIQIVSALRQQTNAIFRVDANCAWSVQQTIAYAKELKSLGVEFIEQPLPAEQIELMPEVYQQSVLPLAADESCRTEDDVVRCAGRFHIINIKLVKCGGLTPARRMIAQARQLGMQVMMGCMTESSVGISAIGHVLPLLDYVDMDGALLLANDPADGVSIENGKAIYPNRLGLGVELK